MIFEKDEISCKVGIAQWCIKPQGSEAIQEAKVLGFSCIQIETYAPEDNFYLGKAEVLEGYISKAKEFDMDICGIAVNIVEKIGIPPSFNIYGNTQLGEILRDAIRAATLLDISFVYLPSFNKSEIKNEKNLLDMVKILKETCLLAQEYNIEVASENTLNFQDIARLITLVNEPNFRILIDVYNPFLWGHDVCKIVLYNQAHIADQIHIKDGSGGIMGNERLGYGDAPLERALETIACTGRKNIIYIFENDYHNAPFSSVRYDLAIFQNYLTSSFYPQASYERQHYAS